MTQPTAMATHGARLVDNGYAVIPIMPGSKVPGRFTQGQWTPYPDWSRHCERATADTEVEIWQHWPDCGVGIACGNVVALDIDILDPELAIVLADLAREMLGDTNCVRIGQAPKRLLVYRAATPFAGRKRHPPCHWAALRLARGHAARRADRRPTRGHRGSGDSMA